MSKRKGPLTPDGKKPITIVSASRKTDRINLINTPTPNKKSKKTYEVIDLVSDEEDTPKKTKKTSSVPPSLQQPITFEPYQKQYDEIVDYMKNNPPQNSPDSQDSDAPTPPHEQEPWSKYDIEELQKFYEEGERPFNDMNRKRLIAFAYLFHSIFKELKTPIQDVGRCANIIERLNDYDEYYGIEKALYKWQYDLKYRFQNELREDPKNQPKRELHWNDLDNFSDYNTYNNLILKDTIKNDMSYEYIFNIFDNQRAIDAFTRDEVESYDGKKWSFIFSLKEEIIKLLETLRDRKNLPVWQIKYPEPTQTFVNYYKDYTIPKIEKDGERLIEKIIKVEEYLKKYKWSNMTAASRLTKEKNLPQKAKYNIMEYLG